MPAAKEGAYTEGRGRRPVLGWLVGGLSEGEERGANKAFGPGRLRRGVFRPTAVSSTSPETRAEPADRANRGPGFGLARPPPAASPLRCFLRLTGHRLAASWRPALLETASWRFGASSLRSNVTSGPFEAAPGWLRAVRPPTPPSPHERLPVRALQLTSPGLTLPVDVVFQPVPSLPRKGGVVRCLHRAFSTAYRGGQREREGAGGRALSPAQIPHRRPCSLSSVRLLISPSPLPTTLQVPPTSILLLLTLT